MIRRAVLCLLIQTSLLLAQEADFIETDKVTIASFQPDGKILRTGLGFLYDETTIVCSYSDVKGASQIEIRWDGTSTYTNRLVSFSEPMDLAVLSAEEELPVVTPIASSNTLAQGDRVFYWIEQGGLWKLTRGSVHEILDTGKGYNLILIESNQYSARSTPLYNSDNKIVGWLQGKRAIPMETIASLAERPIGSMTIADLNSADASWKFEKPIKVSQNRFSFSEKKTVSGPVSFSFKVDLPDALEQTDLAERSGRFHVRYERTGICVEVRAAPLGEDEILSALDKAENLIFTNFLRAELIPFSVENFTGFRAFYEDNDPMNPYELQVFYTISSENLYILSIAYPKKTEEDLNPLVEQIFSSFRF